MKWDTIIKHAIDYDGSRIYMYLGDSMLAGIVRNPRIDGDSLVMELAPYAEYKFRECKRPVYSKEPMRYVLRGDCVKHLSECIGEDSVTRRPEDHNKLVMSLVREGVLEDDDNLREYRRFVRIVMRSRLRGKRNISKGPKR